MKYRGIIYCVHLGGIGHIKRMLTLSQELIKFSEIIFIQAGISKGITFNHKNFKHLCLPFDPEFNSRKSQSYENLLKLFTYRKKILFREIDFTQKIDFILTEQIPFTKLLWFNEVLSIIMASKAINPQLKVFCSHKGSTRNLNSQLDENSKMKYLRSDEFTASIINHLYDHIFVHADSALLDLNENFFSFDKIKEKVSYTGFISSNGKNFDQQKRNKNEILVTLGAGLKLDYFLPTLLDAFIELPQYKFTIVTGFLASPNSVNLLKENEKKYNHIEVVTFIEKIDQKLLTCSMAIVSAGFTLINTYATETPTLIIPDPREGSQNYLAQKFKDFNFVNLLNFNDINKETLKKMIEETIHSPPKSKFELNIDGAHTCAQLIHQWLDGGFQ